MSDFVYSCDSIPNSSTSKKTEVLYVAILSKVITTVAGMHMYVNLSIYSSRDLHAVEKYGKKYSKMFMSFSCKH